MIRGVDLSHHLGRVDYAVLAAQQVEFVIAKTSEHGSFRDPTFDYNWRMSRDRSMLFGGFHFVRSASSSSAQVENIKRVVGDRDVDLFALDCEDPLATPRAFTTVLVGILRRLEGYFSLDLPLVIYTRAEWWERMVLETGYPWRDHPLWLAQYKTSWPRVPRGWQTWDIWQTGQAPGGTYGVSPLHAREIDLNLWNEKNPAFPFPRKPVLPEMAGVQMVAQRRISVYRRPKKGSGVVGRIEAGKIVRVVDVPGDENAPEDWLQLAAGRFAGCYAMRRNRARVLIARVEERTD